MAHYSLSWEVGREWIFFRQKYFSHDCYLLKFFFSHFWSQVNSLYENKQFFHIKWWSNNFFKQILPVHSPSLMPNVHPVDRYDVTCWSFLVLFRDAHSSMAEWHKIVAEPTVADTIVDPGTVVVHLAHTAPTHGAVVCPGGFEAVALGTLVSNLARLQLQGIYVFLSRIAHLENTLNSHSSNFGPRWYLN